MKTVYMRVTPDAPNVHLGISLYSCPDTLNDPAKTLAKVQKAAVRQGVKFTYELATAMQYHAVNSARMWLLSEPDDVSADQIFRSRLVRGGVIEKAYNTISVTRSGEDNHRVQVITATHCTTIDTKSGDVIIEQIPKAVTDLKEPAPVTICIRCGKPRSSLCHAPIPE